MLDSIPGWVFIVGVSLLISTIAYSLQLFVILPYVGWWTTSSFQILVPFNILVLLVFYNYYRACFTDPGKVPSGWEPPFSVLKRQDGSERRSIETGTTGPRFCKTCQHYKPPRAHHCRYCKRCVLKFDHHCPWIDNCVGHDNYPYFFRFIIYVDLACGYAFGLLIWRVRTIMDEMRHFRFNAEPSTTEVTFLILNFVLSAIVLFCVGILSIYHIYCISRGQTSVESHERSSVKALIRRGKIKPVEYPYDIGMYRNITLVLGSNPLLWLVPRGHIGDGLSFPVRPGTDPRLPYHWPPRDPDDLRPSIFSNRYKRQQQLERRSPRSHPLVRRDSEGYLVREITSEERLEMLQCNTPGQTVEEPYLPEDNDADSVEDYYDSGSCVSDEEIVNQHGPSRWMSNQVYELSGSDYYSEDRYWEDYEGESPETPMAYEEHMYDEDPEDDVPLLSLKNGPKKGLAPKDVKSD